MNIFIKIGILPLLILLFMIGWLAYITGDKKYHAQVHAQAKVIAREVGKTESVSKK